MAIYTYVLYGVEEKVLSGLGRPALGASFVKPDVQCPQKPRGRKKKQTSEPPKQVCPPRPSAAACGFSTEGMSDEEVWKKIKATYGQGAIPSANEGIEEPSVTTKRKKSIAKDPVNTAVETETKKCKKARRSKSKKVIEVENHEVAKASTSSAASSKKPDVKPKKSKRRRRQSKQALAEECNSSSQSRKRKAGKLSEEEIQQQEKERAAAAKQAAKQAAKARISRKSSAYHKAVLAAKKNGASKEEQVAAGKAVS